MTRKSCSTSPPTASPPTTSSQKPSPATTHSEPTEPEDSWKWQLPSDVPYPSFNPLDTPRPWHITSLALAQQRQASQHDVSSQSSFQTTTPLHPTHTPGNTTPRSHPRSTTSSPLLPPSTRQQQKRPHQDPHYPVTYSRPSSSTNRLYSSTSTSPSPPTAAHPSYNPALTSDSNPTKISMQYYQQTRQVNEYRLMFRVEERGGEVQRWKRRVIEVS